MKKLVLWLVSAALVFAVAGCAGSVKRINPEEVVDLSGRWNDTDSKLTAEKMVDSALGMPWLTNFMKQKGKNPTVIVGTIRNKTDEHIAIDTFQKDIERVLLNSGKVDFVASKGEREEVREEREDMQTNASEDTRKAMYQENASDYMLKGVISKIPDRAGNKAVFYYQVDLELIDTQSSRKVWMETKEIKKFITGAGARY